MPKYIKELTLDISGKRNNQTITAKQGDNKSRFIRITLVDGETKVTLEQGENVDFRCLKPDKKSCKLPTTIEEGGTILVELDDNSLAVAGLVRADVEINNADGLALSSTTFYIQVEPSADNGNYIPSTSNQKMARSLDMDGHGIQNLPAPTENGDAVNKEYVDSLKTEPYAKSITFKKDLLVCQLFKSTLPIEGNFFVRMSVRIPVLEYSVVSGEFVTKDLVSDYRPVLMYLIETGEPRIDIYDHCFDISEFFYTIQTSGKIGWVSVSDMERTLLSLGCTRFEHSVSVSREEYSNTSGIGRLIYNYIAYFEDEATRDVVTSQLIEPFLDNIQFFTVDFINITEKEAEVINNE